MNIQIFDLSQINPLYNNTKRPVQWKTLRRVDPVGLEPTTSRMQTGYSTTELQALKWVRKESNLSPPPTFLELGVEGIEPSTSPHLFYWAQ